MPLILNENINELTKETILSNISDNVISLSFDNANINVSLVKQYIEKINELFPNETLNIKLTFNTSQNFQLDTNDCKKLEEIDNYLETNYNSQLYIGDSNTSFESYTFKETLQANRNLDDIALKIKSMTIISNGQKQPLSPYEKFMLAYEYVTEHLYKDAGYDMNSRDWIPVMNGDNIVCLGYANLLQALCNKIFDNGEVLVNVQSLDVYSKNGQVESHANNIVYINDPKYNINGMYYCDPCWDAIKENTNNRYSCYCLMPLSDIKNHKNYTFDFTKSPLTNLYLNQDKNPIDLELNRQQLIEGLKNNPNYSKFANLLTNFNTLIDPNNQTQIDELAIKLKNDLLNKYQLLNNFPDIKVNPSLFELFNQESLEKLLDPNIKEEEINQILTNIIENENKNQFLLDDNSVPLNEYLVNLVKDKQLDILIKQGSSSKEQLNTITKDLNNLFNSPPIPLQAICNAYAIIGLSNNEKDIKDYAKKRILQSAIAFEYNFDTTNTKSPISKLNITKKELPKQ